MSDSVWSFISEVFDVAHKMGLPGWEIAVLTLAAAVVWVLGRRGVKALANMPPPPPGWDPEKGTGPLSPPMDMPKDGMPLDQKPPDSWI